MPLVFGAICPHPPIIIPEIGQENLNKVQNTISAFLELEKKLVDTKPDNIIIISPHTPLEINKFNILGSPELSGDFSQFGDFKNKMYFKNDLELVKLIKEKSSQNNLPVKIIQISSLDHGVLVPLFYLTSGKLDNLPIVVLSFSFLSFDTHFQFGKIIGNVIKRNKKRIAFIASGDLSHRLTYDAPAGYSKQGEKFDKIIIELIKKNKIFEILKIDPEFADQAGECGLRSIIVLLGVFSGLNYEPEILSYEGPFGVGYLVANFKIK